MKKKAEYTHMLCAHNNMNEQKTQRMHKTWNKQKKSWMNKQPKWIKKKWMNTTAEGTNTMNKKKKKRNEHENA